MEQMTDGQANRKRAWFQIHLSVAIVMMFAAAVILFFNVRKRVVYDKDTDRYYGVEWGWPLTTYKHISTCTLKVKTYTPPNRMEDDKKLKQFLSLSENSFLIKERGI